MQQNCGYAIAFYRYEIWHKLNQDSIMSYYDLGWEARVNIAADKLANQRSKQLVHEKFNPSIHTFSTDQIIVKWKGKKMSNYDLNLLYDKVTMDVTEGYWRDVRGWSVSCTEAIDWQAFGDAFTKADRNVRRRIVRLASNHGPTGDNMVKWKKRDYSNCPACDYEDEDMDHVLKCPKTKANRNSLIQAHSQQWLFEIDHTMLSQRHLLQ